MPTLDRLPLPHLYQRRILNVAHRGARQQAPENTLAAFTRAADIGADGIELDVQLSADDEVVVIHDATLDRTTHATGPVQAHTLADLRALDAGSWFDPAFAGERIPTLAEVFEAVGNRLLMNVEIKSFGLTERATSLRLVRRTLEVIEQHNMADRVIVSSFNPLTLGQVRRAAPHIALGALHTPAIPLPIVRDWPLRPLIGPYQARHPHYSVVDRRYVRWCHRHGYRVNVWTVNEIADIRRMRDLGVDMIMSDYPDRVQSVLQGAR